MFYYPTKSKTNPRQTGNIPFGIYDTSQYKTVKPRLISYRFKTEPDEKEDRGSDSMADFRTHQSEEFFRNRDHSGFLKSQIGIDGSGKKGKKPGEGKGRNAAARKKMEKEKFQKMKKEMYEFSLVENGSEFVKDFPRLSR